MFRKNRNTRVIDLVRDEGTRGIASSLRPAPIVSFLQVDLFIFVGKYPPDLLTVPGVIVFGKDYRSPPGGYLGVCCWTLRAVNDAANIEKHGRKLKFIGTGPSVYRRQQKIRGRCGIVFRYVHT